MSSKATPLSATIRRSHTANGCKANSTDLAPRKSTARRSTVAQPGGYSSDAIRNFRGELGLSQSLFADLLGVSKSLVEHWERGVRPPSTTIRRLLDAIRARPDSFMLQVHIDQPQNRRGA